MGIVKKYQARVVAIHNQIEGVYTIEIESLGKPFKYEPGQFLHLAMDEYDPCGQWPDSRCFSMQSEPNQAIIKITYAVKGEFTCKMEKQMHPGSEITLKLPYGDMFIRPHNKENTVFISGGTGITPFLSLFNHTSFAEYSNPVLYAGFRNRSMNLYHAELEMAQKIDTQFRFNLVYQEENGVLNIEEIYKTCNLLTTFFISGPPLMISTFKKYLLKQGITENQIITDDWE
jgi:ferredoxin-NADP reductase